MWLDWIELDKSIFDRCELDWIGFSSTELLLDWIELNKTKLNLVKSNSSKQALLDCALHG